MRRSLTPLIFFFAMAGSLLIAPPSGASVPDKPFTQTLCEGDSDSIARLYTAGLGRQPEQGGFDFWITEYTLGTWTFPRMAQFFVNSPEFQESYGTLTQDAFIRQLYRNVLGREGEQGGVTFWNGEMSAGMTRATVLMRFAESPENIERSGTAEPTLGPFNEGRPEGPWRCGPSLADSLLQLSDFPADWERQQQSEVTQERGADCDTAFYLPIGSEGVLFRQTEGGSILLQGSYIAPTAHGAERYLAQAREGIENCASHVSSQGINVTISEVDLPSLGDDSVAIRFDYDGLQPYSALVIRHGRIVTAVQDFGDRTPLSLESYGAVLVQRVAALPFTP